MHRESSPKLYFISIALTFLIVMSAFLQIDRKDKTSNMSDAVNGNLYYHQALAERLNGKPDSAIVKLQKAYHAFLSEQNTKDAVKSLLVMADIAKDKRDSHQMSYYLHLADSLFQYGQLADDSLRAELSHQFGVLHFIKGEYEAAQQNFMQSYHLKIRLYGEKDTSLAVTYNNLGICAYRIGRINEALAYYQKAIERARTMQSSPNILLARCIENAAMIYCELGNYNKSMQNFADALHIKLLASGENSQDVGRAYMNIANLEIDLSDYDNALMHLQKAEKIFLNLYGNDFGDFDAIYQNMGKIYNSRGDYEKALNYYNKAIEYLKRKNPEHPGIRDIYLNIGYIYFVRDDYEKALSYYRKSYSSTSPNLQTIKYYRNLARCYQSMGKVDSAIYYYEKSIQLSKTDEVNNYELAINYLYLGEFYYKKGNFLYAKNFYNISKNLFKSSFGERNRDLAYCYIKIGEVERDIGNYESALRYFQQAIVTLIPGYDDENSYSIPVVLPQTPDYYLPSALESKALTLYRMWERTKDTSYLLSSSSHYILASQSLDRIRSFYTSEESIIQLSGNIRRVLQEGMRTHITLYKVLNRQEFLEEALRFSEKSKSAILWLAFRDIEESSLGNIPTTYLQEERNLKNKITGYKKLIYNEQLSKNPINSKVDLWNAEIFNLERQLDSLLQKIQKEYPRYYANKYEGKGLQIKELQSRLNNEVIVEYAFCDTNMYTFLVAPHSFRIFEASIDSSFYKAIPILLSIIKRGPIDDAQIQFENFTQASYLLYDNLWKPIENSIIDQKVIIVPDGLLGYIPFETLLRQLPNSKLPEYAQLDYLMNSFRIRYAYLASNLLSKEEINQNLKTMASYAPVEFKPSNKQKAFENFAEYPTNLMALPASFEEIKKISKIWKGDIFSHNDASEAKFKTTANLYKIIHLATHSIVDSINPAFSKFVMYDTADSIEDNLLNAYEIPSIKMEAQLVVLNTCNSGSGKMFRGEGIYTLARAFIYAGIPSVVTTLWEIDDDIGSNIVQRFYKKLRKGIPVDEALLEAKLDYLKSSNRMQAHPYFWSSYIAMGNSDNFITENPAINKLLIWIINGLFILLAGFALIKFLRK